MAINQITQQNCSELLERTPKFVTEYTMHYYPDGKGISQSFYRRLVEIERFLIYYATYGFSPAVTVKELELKHIEEVSVSLIQSYLEKYSKIRTQSSSLKAAISSLSSFWSYFTNYSYTLERGKPLFYRHAWDEWKIGYSQVYETIKKEGRISSSNKVFFTEKELLEILDFIDNSYILTLNTPKKVSNWERDKERNLAIIALIMGTGITLEEMVLLTVRDIDMRKKRILVKRDGKTIEVPILDFATPYLTAYLAYRRKWWVADKTVPALFLNQKKKAATIPLFTTVIHNISKSYPRKLSARILQDSHGGVVYNRTNSFLEVQNVQGIRSLDTLAKYIK